MEMTEAEAAQQAVRQGMLLPPGYKPEDPIYTHYQLNNTIRYKFSPPLTQEEIDCWAEHRYLQCPVSGETVEQRGAGIGVGIYQMPYALPESEKQRQSENDRKFAEKRAAGQVQAASVDDLFQVYPVVAAPPTGQLKNDFWVELAAKGEQVHLGRLKVCIGHYFSKKAYNWGITGNPGQLFDPQNPLIWKLEDRGVKNLFQQYNACVFRWAMVKPEGDGHYTRKSFNVTNRLSLYATSEHGKDVLKGLIESQLSLLLYNQTNIFRKKPQLLPSAARKAFPRILKAVIEEVMSEKNQGTILDEEYQDHVIRTYCWIHQVAIKFIKHHQHVYEHIYRSIMRWVQNPFAAENRRAWPQIEELLVACSLVNIPWAVVREAFVRRLFSEMAELASGMKDQAEIHQRLRHMFHQNQKRIQSILMTMSFHLSKPLGELDRQYERCGGLLPKQEREKIKRSIAEIQKVTCLEEFWCTLGMDNPALPKKELTKHLDTFFQYIVANNGSWSIQAIDPRVLNAIQVPAIQEPEQIQGVQTQGGILNYRQHESKLRKERQERLWKQHQGMPILPKTGELSHFRCNYHHCGLEFTNRSQLFEHLKEALPSLGSYYHQNHQAKAQAGRFLSRTEMENDFNQASEAGHPHHWTCPACFEQFTDFESVRKHLRDVGVEDYFEPGDQLDELLAAEETERLAQEDAEAANATGVGANAASGPGSQNNVGDPYTNLETCIICLSEARGIIFLQCGHLIACSECANMVQNCPICRAVIQQRLPVAYREQTNVQIFQV